MELRRYFALLFWGIFGSAWAQDFYIVTPSTFRLNSNETVAIAIDGHRDAIVRVNIQDYPGKIKTIFEKNIAVQPGAPIVFSIRLDANEFPPNFLASPGSPKLVSLSAHFQNLSKNFLIPISIQSGYMFIQTDKPIYTPKQTAFFRIISLTEEGLPSNELFQLQIRNPHDIIVEETFYNQKNKTLVKAFANHIYKFPTYPVLGEWTATVRYGYNLKENSTVRFEVQEYVLPTFTVELSTSDIILPNDETIEVDVLAKYVYGKKVKGMVTFRLGVKKKYTTEAIFFAVVSPKELDTGAYTLRVKTEDLKLHKDIGWFPEIHESHFVVEATVLDHATGNKEVVTYAKGIFSKSPFFISFKKCLSDFKPGLTSVFQADIIYLDGKPASGVLTRIKAVADDGKILTFDQNERSVISDENGKVSFEVQPEMHHKTVTLTLETDDPRYAGSQAIGIFKQNAYNSLTNAYIAIARSSLVRLKPGDMYGREVHFEPAGIRNIYCVVIARGKILLMNKLKPGAYKHQKLDIKITHDMVPSFRVVVFAHHGNELIADSLKLEVEKACNPSAQVDIDVQFSQAEPAPGSNGKILIRGTAGASVGLLGVDEAVYVLSKKDLLTKEKVYDRLESHDLGCGSGGGVTINSVLGNAGITVATNKFSPSHSYSCTEIKRRKRAAAQEITNAYNEKDKQCCALGIEKDKHDRSCGERVSIINKLDEIYPNCSNVFLDCCLQGRDKGLTDLMMSRITIRGRMREESFDEPEFIDAEFEDAFEGQISVRKDFKETWIYENIIIGSDKRKEIGLSLPDSITTWVIQAVSVSPEHGICVAEPKKLTSFKNLFLHLNLPYSVVRNEQVEIQATVFNYGDKRVGALVYMYGVEDLCSGLQPGEKSERKRLSIDAQSAETVTFPVIPLKAENYPIKVVVLSPVGNDVVQKELHVVPEGITKEMHIPIKLDPTNQQRRGKRSIENGIFTDHIDPDQNLQVTTIKLSAEEGFVPGTESCSITALGDMYGPVVETAINNPDDLLQEPFGCGEQNMFYLAPTLYTMRYLKVVGKLTADREAKGYQFIRIGYDNQLNYRKDDGSYSAFPKNSPSSWLTAFVMKVFCQAKDLVYIDDNVICSGVKWLIKNQEDDGSYIEKHASYKSYLMGGIDGRTPMTAFALIALEECKCDHENLFLAKKRAVAYLEDHLIDVQKPLTAAVVAYALSLSNSDLKKAANDKLMSYAKYDEDNNWMYWITENSGQDVETAGYALLTQLLFNDMVRSTSIVNWLNSKRKQSGAFKSTQDTVIALQSLSEYAIRAQHPPINLVANISSSNDRNFHRVLKFNEDNALVLQDVQVDKIGGTLFINTAGHGTGSLTVKLRYNMIVPIEDICKFDVTVNVTHAEREKVQPEDAFLTSRRKYLLDRIPDEAIRGVKNELDRDPVFLNGNRRRTEEWTSLIAPTDTEIRRRIKRQSEENNKFQLNISLCVRYLGNEDAEMSIVDVGIFSGFEPVVADLRKLETDSNHLIQRFEKSSRGVIFYLQKVPIAENYCFSFHVNRQYIVGNTKMSAIKVYDYYNPDAVCTKFYSPGSNSPLLRTICAGGICECAEGGCPPKKPFSQFDDLPDRERRDYINTDFCENYDYVWKGILYQPVRKDGGFFNISFLVEEVIKAGIEQTDDIKGDVRTLLARDNCQIANLTALATYLILGRDGQAYKNADEEKWYRYVLDQTSIVHLWTSVKQSQDPKLQRDLFHVRNKLIKNGCEL